MKLLLFLTLLLSQSIAVADCSQPTEKLPSSIVDVTYTNVDVGILVKCSLPTKIKGATVVEIKLDKFKNDKSTEFQIPLMIAEEGNGNSWSYFVLSPEALEGAFINASYAFEGYDCQRYSVKKALHYANP